LKAASKSIAGPLAGVTAVADADGAGSDAVVFGLGGGRGTVAGCWAGVRGLAGGIDEANVGGKWVDEADALKPSRNLASRWFAGATAEGRAGVTGTILPRRTGGRSNGDRAATIRTSSASRSSPPPTGAVGFSSLGGD